MYKKTKDNEILYQNNMNIVLANIFINSYPLGMVFYFINNHNFSPQATDKVYYNYEKTKINNNFNEIKSGILYDYISRDDLFIKDLDVESFDDLRNNLNKILSNIPSSSLDFTKEDIIYDFKIFMKILDYVYENVEIFKEWTDKYNYLLFINKYKNFNDIKDEKAKDTNYKSLKSFINTYNRNIIKNKFALNLTSLIYLSYKTNIEANFIYRYNHYMKKRNSTPTNVKIAQYMILDYFWGISTINNPCIPINKRQVLIQLLGKKDSDELRKTPITKEREKIFYKNFDKIFKQIKQYTFYDKVRYTDCGETTILNIFNYFLLKEDGSFDLSDSDSWDIKLKEFYLKYPTMKSMTTPPINILKQDLSIVFNERGDNIIYNLKKEQCDINTTMDSMIKTCCFLLNIKTDNFIDIFKKLNKNVKNENVVVSANNTLLTYSDIFTVSLHEGHGEFNLRFNFNLLFNYDISEESTLETHWISLDFYPTEYSLEHFKFFLKTEYNYFIKNFPVEKQTEEICLAAINVDDKTLPEYQTIAYNNFKSIKNKTYKICEFGVSVFWHILKEVPKDLINKELCSLAFYQNVPQSYQSMEYIPFEFQDKEMVDKIKEMDDKDESKASLLKLINPELLK